ncbi:SDR family NAD(P)-dependent oxidoreductase [Gordonia sp. HNM0687]|uniref:SDR family NAD(P)-dependent oxidoreductase n=1 Tax=Gordonia mangrovi TaxID=2665643 RepID=A0A6L7GW38_9ACTN|nr:SDR family NAD(P)-dependent oxidoreductase [Gordonia mangrovi]
MATRVADQRPGPVLCAKAFLPALRRSGSGAIVHFGSIDGTLGDPSVPAYSVSKGAISTLTRVMAEEIGQWGIRVMSSTGGRHRSVGLT